MASLSPTASAWKANLLKWCQLTPSHGFIQRCPAERACICALGCVIPVEIAREGRTITPLVLVSFSPFPSPSVLPALPVLPLGALQGRCSLWQRASEERQQLLALTLLCPLGTWMWHTGTRRTPPAHTGVGWLCLSVALKVIKPQPSIAKENRERKPWIKVK